MDRDGTSTIGVIGAGAWGTALAACLAAAGNRVLLWGREGGAAAALATDGTHRALPGFRLPDAVELTTDLGALRACTVLILALPAQSTRALAPAFAASGLRPERLVTAAKGLEQGTQRTMPDLLKELWPDASAGILSGPTFATELARGLPGAATLAADRDPEGMAALFAGGPLRVYASNDVTGVAIGGAAKNVLAIAAGAVMGAGLGANARAAVISRGLAEMTRLGVKLGARPETLAGLSGLGDVVLSCTDDQSRNYRLGLALGQGATPTAALTEGAHTVEPMLALAAGHGIDMPIATAVDAVLNRGMPLPQAVAGLMARPGGAE